MIKQVLLKISGRVQGVFYRASAREEALELGLVGYARNLADGMVEILAQGEEKALAKLVEWCREGPKVAEVSEVKVEWGEVDQVYQGFEIL